MRSSPALLAILGVLTVSGSALACPRSEYQLICTQDTVVDSDNNRGVVIAINPYAQNASVRRDWDGRMETVAIPSVALAEGCVGGACVGDKVLDSDNNSGHVIAVNPYNHTLALLRDWDGRIETARVSSVAVAYGCVGNICPDQHVVDADNNAGVVVAVNPYNGTAGVRRNWDGRNETVSIMSLALAEGCMNGICVGDKVVDSDNNSGIVAGIGFYRGNAAVQRDWDGRLETTGLNTLGITNYCQTYGDEFRRRPPSLTQVVTVTVTTIFDYRQYR